MRCFKRHGTHKGRILFSITLIYSIWDAARKRPEPVIQPQQQQGPYNYHQPNAFAIGNITYEMRDMNGYRYDDAGDDRKEDITIYERNLEQFPRTRFDSPPFHDSDYQVPYNQRSSYTSNSTERGVRPNSSFSRQSYGPPSPQYMRRPDGDNGVNYGSRPVSVSPTGNRSMDEALRRATSPNPPIPVYVRPPSTDTSQFGSGNVSTKARPTRRPVGNLDPPQYP